MVTLPYTHLSLRLHILQLYYFPCTYHGASTDISTDRQNSISQSWSGLEELVTSTDETAETTFEELMD